MLTRGISEGWMTESARKNVLNIQHIFLSSLNTPLIKLVYNQNVIKSQPHAEKKFGAILIFIHGLCHMYKSNLLFLTFRWKMFTFIV